MKILKSFCLSLFVMLSCSWACGQNGPTQPSVILAWTQSTTPGVTANCVYRGLASKQYVIPALYCSSTPITNFTDTTVSRGTTYFYAVTAQVSGTESGYSNEVSAMPIPINPPNGNGEKTTKLERPSPEIHLAVIWK
jgi:fibronectin type 3 domain-containing protein